MKSNQVYSNTVSKLNWKSIGEKYLENPQVSGNKTHRNKHRSKRKPNGKLENTFNWM